MNQPIIQSAGTTGDVTEFILREGTELSGMRPAGRMITDTDSGTFVYLLDDGERFVHVHFPEEVWPQMATALQSGQTPELSGGGHRLELVNFAEELEMLIFNIEGNDNYGEVFSTAVEKAFSQILGA
ncbi:hypothetical protein SAMN04488127_2269 [Bhargavaea ginsengi]|uniref:Uncharacterized protein n=1 Tax=Bhargavaea ginsengi TaxID=426757 RepID=A0A1H7AIP7_9BACL|nr:hypothetical protein [Bhargavaea ginsengi]SEJ60885.1 hypothetical protein SAMN04488127_2269 [Bhargavaea ginsengi]